ncbi:MAG: ABC transporter substrate-binding protein [Anaerolineae bacterium]|nr:ABC transporter substrate-binding protein [Anaerolineae bacterium]
MKTQNIIVLFAFVISLLAAACTAQPVIPTLAPTEPPPAPMQPTAEPTETVQPATSSPTGITVVDALGREVQFAVPPQRVALAGKGSVLIFDALYLFPEAKTRLVTLGQGAQGKENFIAVIDPDHASKPILPPDVSPEQLLALKPDVVVLKSYLSETVGKPLESVGTAVVYVDFETPDQYWRDIRNIGQLFNNTARAEEIVSYFQARIDQVDQSLAGVDDSQKPRVLLLYYSEKDGQVAFNVPPVSWLQTLLVNMAGGIPVWTDIQLEKGWTKVNLEQIAAWDADQIYIIDYFGDVDKTVAGLQASSEWQQLRAVKEGKLYAFPKDFVSWDQPTPRWILGLQWLATKIHPELFGNLDMQQEIRGFYDTMYGLDDKAYQEHIQPKLKGSFE